MATLFLLASPNLRAAAPLAGTTIGNQASATYTDASGTDRQATSNTVTTIVQPVHSHTLVADRNVTVPPGGQVSYPHVVTNTGNASDSYTLAATNEAGDDFDINGLNIYADVNKDGIPDSNTPLAGAITLAAGEEYGYVITGSAPGTVTAGNTSDVKTTATSTAGSPVQTNTDTATVTANAVLSVTKSISSNSGPAPSTGDITYTLTYTNTGNTAATGVTLTDVIPTGMTYQSASGRWSSTGTTTLTDASKTDDQSGIIYDYNITTATTVTAVIAVVNPGSSGTVSFAVRVNAGVTPGTIPNTANFKYDPDGAGATAATTLAPTNTVPYTVDQLAGVRIGDVSADTNGETPANGSGLIYTVATASAGTTVTFKNQVKNTGNGTDSFDITISANGFPSGTNFILYKSDGNTPLVDSNGNSTPDTGPLAPGGTYDVVVKAVLPTNIGASATYAATVKATSKVDSLTKNTVVNKLTGTTALTVDLTNNDIVGGGSVLGTGAGPEGTAVVTNTTDPAATTRFTLYANNPVANGVADSYDITTSVLPSGWTVVFHDENGAVITNTGAITSGGNKKFYADVTPPAGTVPGTSQINFKIQSPTTGVSDEIRDAVTVNTVRKLAISPNNSGQTYPGGAVVYEHTLTNNGNVTEGGLANLGDAGGSRVALTQTNSLTSNGWSSVIYWDKNNDGTLDPNDPVVADTSFLSGGTAGLAPLESVRLFTKVFAPPGAPNLAQNATVLTATTTNGTGTGKLTTTEPLAVTATDTTSVITGDLTLVKTQVLDANCDGTETSYSLNKITTGAVPGACVKYQIVVTNTGSALSKDVVVYDTTPAYTTYSETPAAAVTGGAAPAVTTKPTAGAAGNFKFTVGDLAAGASATITFSVKINN